MPVDQTSLEQPTFERGGRCIIHVPDVRVAGWFGTVPERESNALLTDRHPDRHRLRALDAYAFSTVAIDVMKAVDCGYVLVREQGVGDVYEWKFDALRYADLVPEEFLEHPDDPQRFLPRESARAVWRRVGDALEPDRQQGGAGGAHGGGSSEQVAQASDPDDRLEEAYRRGEAKRT